MQKGNTIEHTGIVRSVENDHVVVDIISHPACSGCMASGICDLSDRETKQISTIADISVKAGERVLVVMNQTMGFRALFLGYLLPFILVMVILITLSVLSVSEPVTGIAALVSLIPYYLFIYLSKERIGRSFSFSIKKEFT